MFQVFDNNKLAQYPNMNVDPSWKNANHDTKEAALIYAHKWLGGYACCHDYHDWPKCTNLDKPYDYTGYGDIIEIRECLENGQ